MEQRNAVESKLFRAEASLKDFAAKKKEAEVLAEENRKLAAALNQSAEKLKASEQFAASVKMQNTSLQNKVNDMESGKIVLSSEKKLRDDLSVERQTVASLKAAAEKLRTEKQKSAEDLAKLREENKKVVLDLVKLTEVVAKLRGDNNNLAKVVEDQKAKIDAGTKIAAENAELKKNIAAISRNFETYRQKSVNDASAKVKDLNAALENARAEYRAMSERLRKAEENTKQSIAKLQQTIIQKEEEKAALRQSLTLSKQDVSTAKSALEKLSVEYQTLKREFDALNTPKKVVVAPAPVIKKVEVKEIPAVKKETPSPAVVAANKDLKEKLEKLTVEFDLLKKENAKYRVQLAAFHKLQKEVDSLRAKLAQANSEISKKDTEKVAFMEKIRVLNLKVDEQALAIKSAQETITRKDAVLSSNTKDLQNAVTLLKKQLLAAQNSEAALRKELELLKMEYADLEKKNVDSVPRGTLTALRDQVARLDKELTNLRSAKAQSDASLKAAEILIKQQSQRLTAYADKAEPETKKQVSKLTAAVVELQEAKIQYESLLSKLRVQVKELNEENKELRLANTSLRSDVAELKIKPEELRKSMADLKEANTNLRKANESNSAKVQQLNEKVNADAKTITSLKQEVASVQSLAQRYRKELNDWGELPQVNLTEELSRKNKAIDLLVAENASLSKEKDMLKTELTLSKDYVVKYKKLVLDLDTNLQMNRLILARVKNSLARFTSAAEVEKLVTGVYDSKKGEFGAVAPVNEVRKTVEAIKKADTPKFTPEQIAEREAAYKSAMESGLNAEKAKDYSEALISYWRASDLCTDGAEVHKALARVYLAKRDFNNARDNYKVAVQKYNLKRDPDFEEKLIILAQEVADEAVANDASRESNKRSGKGTTGNK